MKYIMVLVACCSFLACPSSSTEAPDAEVAPAVEGTEDKKVEVTPVVEEVKEVAKKEE